MNDWIRSCLRECGPSCGIGDPDACRFVVLDSTHAFTDGHTILVFSNGSPFPRAIAKLARTETGRAIFEFEFHTLEALHAAGMNTDRQRTPRPLGKFWNADYLLTLQSAFEGPPMKNVRGSDLFSPARVRGTFDQLSGWWDHFLSCFPPRVVTISRDRYHAGILSKHETFQEHFDVTPEIERLLKRHMVEGRRLEGVELPMTCRHGDFVAANIIQQDDGPGVFDWEFGLEADFPLFDQFMFFSSLRFPFSGSRSESDHFSSFTSVFWEESYLHREMCEQIRSFCRRYGIGDDVVGELFLLSLVEMANMKYASFAESGGCSETETMRRRFRSFSHNVPFSCIDAGISRSLQFVAEHGLPTF